MVKRQEVGALRGRDSSATHKSSKCALQPEFRHCPEEPLEPLKIPTISTGALGYSPSLQRSLEAENQTRL